MSEMVFGHCPQQHPLKNVPRVCSGAYCGRRLRSTGTDGGFEKGAAAGLWWFEPLFRAVGTYAYASGRDACSA